MTTRDSFDIKVPPFETAELRLSLAEFMKREYLDPVSGASAKVGSFRWGVYAFFDYDDEPIYVGQTKESVSGRVGRHLTGQRSDAVAKSVLDPLEVKDIEIWPLPQFKEVKKGKDPKGFAHACKHLDALEYAVHQQLIAESRFGAILNEKNPPTPVLEIPIPKSLRECIVPETVMKIRGHPDFRIFRRATIISRLSQGIAERKISGGEGGLRRVLRVQAQRLEWLANQRYVALGGETNVISGSEDASNVDD